MNFKKLFTFLICLFCFLTDISGASAKEVSNLYLIKKMPKENLVNIINAYLPHANYNVLNRGDFYITPLNSILGGEFYEIVLEENGSNCYMYYLSNVETNDLSSVILKELKKNHYGVKKIQMTELHKGFAQKAELLKKKSEEGLLKAESYDFGDDAQMVYNSRVNMPVSVNQTAPSNLSITKSNYIPISIKQTRQAKSVVQSQPSPSASPFSSPVVSNQKVLKGTVITIARGTAFNVALQSAISSASLSQSDKITAVLNEDFKYNGYLIFPKETVLYGNALNASAATCGYGNGRLELTFNQALLPSGNKINLVVDKIMYVKTSTRAVNITRDVVVGAGLGILSGLFSAALTGDYSQALLVGASLGAVGGGLHAAVKKGEEIEIPEGSILNLRFSEPINISPYN